MNREKWSNPELFDLSLMETKNTATLGKSSSNSVSTSASNSSSDGKN